MPEQPLLVPVQVFFQPALIVATQLARLRVSSVRDVASGISKS